MNPTHLLECGLAQHRAGAWALAEAFYRNALRLQPRNARAHHLLGVLFHQTRQDESALHMLRAAIDLEDSIPEFHIDFGIVWRALGHPDEAVRSYQRALHLNPQHPDALFNLGNAQKDLGLLEDAAATFRRASEIQPGQADILTNLGATLKDLGHLEEALFCFEAALARQPHNPEAHWQRGIVLLQRGSFAEGWREYEWRWKVPHLLPPRRDPLPPPWDGSTLAGRSILLLAEPGFGDTIQFVRYASVLADQGATVIVACPSPLISLILTTRGVTEVVSDSGPLPPADYHAPLLSLPGLVGTRPDTIPNTVPYLSVPAQWQRDRPLDPGRRLKVGIVWRGNPQKDADRYRSTGLHDWLPILHLPGCNFYSLQCGPTVAELRTLPGDVQVLDEGSPLKDFGATAAIVHQLDLVISVCTAVTHLAGALGKPTWTLLAANACWRWLLHRNETPWYPTMRLFRQKKLGEWPELMERVAQALLERSRRGCRNPVTRVPRAPGSDRESELSPAA
jgi:Flp pilus assembly protein TadD